MGVPVAKGLLGDQGCHGSASGFRVDRGVVLVGRSRGVAGGSEGAQLGAWGLGSHRLSVTGVDFAS